MEDFILIISVTGVMVFGFFMMKRLDAFLASNSAAMQNDSPKAKHSLRIAFSNPLVASGIAGTLERFSKRFPDSAVYLYAGDADTVFRLFASGDIDVAFLPVSAHCEAFAACNKIKVDLQQDGLNSGMPNFPLLPLEDEPIQQLIVWKSSTGAPLPKELLMQIKKDLKAHGGSHFGEMI